MLHLLESIKALITREQSSSNSTLNKLSSLANKSTRRAAKASANSTDWTRGKFWLNAAIIWPMWSRNTTPIPAQPEDVQLSKLLYLHMHSLTVSTLCLTQHSIGASLSPGRLRFPHKLKRFQTASLPCHLHLHLLCLSNYSEPLLCISFFSKDQRQSTSTNQWKWLLFLFPFHFLLNYSKFSNFPSGFLCLDCICLDFTQFGYTWLLQI